MPLFLLAAALALAPDAPLCAYGGPLIAPCAKFGPPQHIRGIWYTGFEESRFDANATSARFTRKIGEHSHGWLIFEGAAAENAGARHIGCTHAVALEFIGRQSFSPSAEDPNFTVFIVDRLLTARPLGSVRTVGLKGYDKECATPQ